MSDRESIVVRTDRGPVVVLTLNRPERRNALSGPLIDALSEALHRAELEPAVRAVVITGAGSVFCAGLDLKEIELRSTDDGERAAVAQVQSVADLLMQVHQMSKPTIAALNGSALAGGAGLATACDFVIAVEGARIGYPEIRRGLVAAMVMHDLVRQVGERRARFLLLTGRTITGAEAAEWGLINHVVAGEHCLEEAIAWGEMMLESAPGAIATAKRLIAEASGRPRDLRGAAAITAQVRVSEEAQEGILAFLEKRKPVWDPRTQRPSD
jgi:methylglutaconyl-CoA hydratase